MTACEESVVLVKEISENVRNKGNYLLNDRRIELIFDHAPDLELKLQRLRSFAKLHHWLVEIHEHGRSVLFFRPPPFLPLPS